jgi:hypothetical protein
MKNRTHCKHAKWKRNVAGNLHPSGQGKCEYPWKVPELPGAFYWINSPIPSGGFINRKHDNSNHCPYWARTEEAVNVATEIRKQ